MDCADRRGKSSSYDQRNRRKRSASTSELDLNICIYHTRIYLTIYILYMIRAGAGDAGQMAPPMWDDLQRKRKDLKYFVALWRIPKSLPFRVAPRARIKFAIDQSVCVFECAVLARSHVCVCVCLYIDQYK